MKTINERINEAVLALAEERVKVEQTGFLELFQIRNGMHKFSDYDSKMFPVYVERQFALGYTEADLTVEACTRTNREWFSYIAVTLRNPLNGSSYRLSNCIMFLRRDQLTKDQLLEAEAPLMELIAHNRTKLLNNYEEAAAFIADGKFFQNNLDKMKVDKETHDYILSVKNYIEAKKQKANEAARNELLTWATGNGSELLKLRIKHNQNWQKIAETEWAIAHTTGFSLWEYDGEDEKWNVENATIEQLLELEKAQSENPGTDINIIRCRWSDEDGYIVHRTFLICKVKTPTSNCFLYREITDVSESEE